MAITSTEVADILGMTTVDTRYSQVVALLPYIIVQINDYCGGGFSRQVKEESISFTSTTTRQLSNYPVVRGSVYVTSTDRGTYFYGDTQFGKVPLPSYYLPSTYVRDYDMSYTTGGINRPSTDSQIESTDTVLVTYAFIDMVDAGKPACAKMVEQVMTQSGGIASESVGSLSRSYFGSGMDPVIKSMLAPYRHPVVI